MERINILKSKDAPSTINTLWLKGTSLFCSINGVWKELNKTLIKKATTSEAGLVMKSVKEELLNEDADSKAIIDKINSLIIKLQAAGLME